MTNKQKAAGNAFARVLSGDVKLRDYITIGVLAERAGLSYGSAYYKLLKHRTQFFVIEGQSRPLFVKVTDANDALSSTGRHA